jgi:hypothetical protein
MGSITELLDSLNVGVRDLFAGRPDHITAEGVEMRSRDVLKRAAGLEVDMSKYEGVKYPQRKSVLEPTDDDEDGLDQLQGDAPDPPAPKPNAPKTSNPGNLQGEAINKRDGFRKHDELDDELDELRGEGPKPPPNKRTKGAPTDPAGDEADFKV